MAFQFQCPQCANVLQAEDFQAGQQSYCPICGAAFLIPSPYVAPAPGAFPGTPYPEPQLPTGPAPTGPAPTGPAPTGPAAAFPSFPAIDTGAAPGPGRGASGHPSVLPPQHPPPAIDILEPELLHIPCPQCKEMLETPVEMLDQDVLCPHCQAQFQLRRRDSVEYRRKKEQEAQIKEAKAGNTWLNLAIVVVVLVVLFLGALIVWDVWGKA